MKKLKSKQNQKQERETAGRAKRTSQKAETVRTNLPIQKEEQSLAHKAKDIFKKSKLKIIPLRWIT